MPVLTNTLMPKINRSEFLNRVGVAFVGVTSFYCSKNKINGTLPFEGSISGEKHNIGHQLRNNNFKLPKIEPEQNVYDVVIAGGGISGLVTAYKLKKANITNVLVLEKEDIVGGLCRGGEYKGLPYACGAHYTEYPEPNNEYVNEIFKDCGIVLRFEDGWPIVDDIFLLKTKRNNLYAAQIL